MPRSEGATFDEKWLVDRVTLLLGADLLHGKAPFDEDFA